MVRCDASGVTLHGQFSLSALSSAISVYSRPIESLEEGRNCGAESAIVGFCRVIKETPSPKIGVSFSLASLRSVIVPTPSSYSILLVNINNIKYRNPTGVHQQNSHTVWLCPKPHGNKSKPSRIRGITAGKVNSESRACRSVDV